MISTKENARDLLTSEFSEVKLFACDAEVFDDVPNDAARHIARVPGKRDDEIRAEGLGIMPVARRCAQPISRRRRSSCRQLNEGYLATGQAASTNLSRKADGIGRPVSRRVSKCALA